MVRGQRSNSGPLNNWCCRREFNFVVEEAMSAFRGVTPEWYRWVRTNLERQCTPESIVSAMIRDGLERELCWRIVNEIALVVLGSPVQSDRDVADQDAPRPLREVGSTGDVMYRDGYDYELSRVPMKNVIQLADRAVNIAVRIEKPEIIICDDLLSAGECEELIQLAIPKLRQSTIVDPTSGENVVIERRTSDGTYFNLAENELVEKLDRRLSSLAGLDVARSEGLQILHYGIGGEYRPHFDYFPPLEPGSRNHVAMRGQRTCTIIMYLNNVAQGGETVFPEIGLSVVPRRGRGVYFTYCNSKNEVDPLTLHGGAPVIHGEKWIATKWFRQCGTDSKCKE